MMSTRNPALRILDFLFLMSIALANLSCARASATVLAKEEGVRCTLVKARHIPDEIKGFGSLTYERKVELYAAQEGKISELLCRQGDALYIGQTVATMRNEQMELMAGRAESALVQAEAALALAEARCREGALAAETRLLGAERENMEFEQAKAELAEASRKLSSQEILFASGALPEETIRSERFSLSTAQSRLELMERDLRISMVGLRDEDLAAAGYPPGMEGEERKSALIAIACATLRAERSAAAARLEAARKELESARLALAELKVLSPVLGVVAAVYVEEGERIKRDDKLLTIVDLSALYALIPVREAEALRIRPGMPALVTVDGASRDFAGTIVSIAPVADSRSASFAVRIAIKEATPDLKPGMFARVSIETGPGRSIAVVPESAFVYRDSLQARVFMVEGGELRMRSLILGDRFDDGWEVVKGIGSGEVLVDRPDPGLKEGSCVRILE